MADPEGTYSVWNGTDPGVFAAPNNDGQPIEVGNVIYVPAAATEAWDCYGARIMVPSGAWRDTATGITVSLYATYDLSLAALTSKLVEVPTADTWTDVIWDAPVTLNEDQPYTIAYTVQGNPNVYFTIPSPSAGQISPVGAGSPLLMPAAAGDGGALIARSAYQYGTGSGSTSAAGWLVGVDMLVGTEPASEPEPSGEGSVTDQQMVALSAYSGSLADRQYEYLTESFVGSDPATITDMQVSLGQTPSLFVEVE